MAQQTEPSTKPSAENKPERKVYKLHELPDGCKVTAIMIGGQVTWRPGEVLSDDERRKRVRAALQKAGL